MNPPRTIGGRSVGTTNWASSDVDRLLDCVEEILPAGQVDWDSIAGRYNSGGIEQ